MPAVESASAAPAGLVVRPARPADAPALADLAAATFALACPPGTDPADIAAFLAEVLSERRFAGYLGDPGRRVLLAELDAEPVGYAMLVLEEPTDPDAAAAVRARPTVELSKLYVRAERHGGGAAAALMSAAVETARASGAASVWLGVNQLNARANRFYEKQGFARVGTKRFLVGEQWHDDFVRERML